MCGKLVEQHETFKIHEVILHYTYSITCLFFIVEYSLIDIGPKKKGRDLMMVLLSILGVISVVALAGTIRETALDGYHRVPTRPELLAR